MEILEEISLMATLAIKLAGLYKELFPNKTGAEKKTAVMAAVNASVTPANQTAIQPVISAFIDNAVTAMNVTKQA